MTDTPRARFGELVQSPDPSLGEGCLLIAEHLGHDLTAATGIAMLDDLAAQVVTVGETPPTIDTIGRFLFDEMGFRGDRENYYDARNSLLGEVLRRRAGIPITLAIVVIEMSRRLDGDACGVGMPGHFLVGDSASPSRWMDPFDSGTWLDADGARQRFRAIHGPGASFDRSFLRPTPAPDILGRVLANLAGVHRGTGDPTLLLRALELRSDIAGVGTRPRARVELAEAYVACGRISEAITVLEAVLEQIDARRRSAVAERLDVLRASLN